MMLCPKMDVRGALRGQGKKAGWFFAAATGPWGWWGVAKRPDFALATWSCWPEVRSVWNAAGKELGWRKAKALPAQFERSSAQEQYKKALSLRGGASSWKFPHQPGIEKSFPLLKFKCTFLDPFSILPYPSSKELKGGCTWLSLPHFSFAASQ